MELENFKSSIKHTYKNKKKISPKLCKEDSLLCNLLLESNKARKRNFSCFIYRQKYHISHIIENYFPIEDNRKSSIEDTNISSLSLSQEFSKNEKSNIENNYSDIDGLVICRHNHICQLEVKNNDSSPEKDDEHDKSSEILKKYFMKSILESRETTDMHDSQTKIKTSENLPINPFILITPEKLERNSLTLNRKNINFNESNYVSLNNIQIQKKKCKSLVGDEEVYESKILTNRTSIKNTKSSIKKEKSVMSFDDDVDCDNSIDIEEENFKSKDSIMIFRKNGIYNNIDNNTLKVYAKEIENSESFVFNRNFFNFE